MAELALFARAEKFAPRTAFGAIEEGAEVVSYGALLERSAALAAQLLGGRPDLQEARIAFAAAPGPDYAIIQWGIWRAGGIALPLNTGATLSEMAHCIDTAAAEEIIVTEAMKEKIQPLCEGRDLSFRVFDELKEMTPVSLPKLDLSRRAMIIFTSGTTNKPKGVVSTHGNIQAQVEMLVDFWQWRPSDVIPLFLPMHHVHGIINVLTSALYSGAQLESFSSGFDMDAVLGRVRDRAYTLFMAVPTIYVKMIEALAAMDPDKLGQVRAGFQSMRLMISGSAALPVKIFEKWQALTGQVLLERYGMTEIGMALSNPVDGERRPGAVGVPLPGVKVQLVTEQGDVVAGEDVPGEIWVRGPAVFKEYWDSPEATQESFRDGWFMTGDMGVLERGYIRIMGRLSVDIIKSGGYKLSALEIENLLLAHEAINECAVVGIEDDTWGEIVAVAVVMAQGASLTLEALQAWARKDMSNYKIPRKLLVVDHLPCNAMGKVTKPDVKALF
jgi:malonyl-CoA/methylmalonyl-CoA synthetase